MNKHSKIRASFLALLALVAIAVWTSVFDRPAASGLLTLNVLDVGQGDSLLITTPLGHHVLDKSWRILEVDIHHDHGVSL